MTADIERELREATAAPGRFRIDDEKRIRLLLDELARLRGRAADAARDADTVCDSYVAENQRLFDRAEAAESERDALRKALEPFAAWVTKLDRDFRDEDDDTIAGGFKGATVTFGDLRAARALTAKGKT